jgi:predicted DNA-binding transcriptional regulator YafY
MCAIFLRNKKIFVLLKKNIFMPVNRNALIRYKTIDNCLQNHYRQWTLDDLIDACSDALYEYEGIDKGISKRTIQMDIQMMRSEKLGYNAPIVVYDNKYYKYDDPDYSITDTPLSEQDLKVMSEAVEVLRQFKGFSYFSDMTDIVSRLEDHVTSAKLKTIPVIDFEKNENLKGLEYLDAIYHAIINKQTLLVKYRSFKAHSANSLIFYPYLLKEYRNRWFVFGVLKKDKSLRNLALDRIHSLEIATNERFLENTFFDPATFFDDLVGVTKGLHSQTEKVRFQASRDDAPYIQTKPVHKSQRTIEHLEDGSAVLEIDVVINQELQREFLGFANGIRILEPSHLVDFMKMKLERAVDKYK